MRFIVMFVTAVCVLFLIVYDGQRKRVLSQKVGMKSYVVGKLVQNNDDSEMILILQCCRRKQEKRNSVIDDPTGHFRITIPFASFSKVKIGRFEKQT